MSKLKLSILALSLFAGISTSQAAIGPTLDLEGYVVSFDSKTIVVESGTQRIEVPVTYYVPKVKVGEKIQIPMTYAELETLKTSDIKKK